MFAIVKNNEIVKTGGSIRALFPNISFPASGPSAEWKAEQGVMEVVEGEQKDQRFYWVTPDNPSLQLINGVPTRVYINTPKALDDVIETLEGSNEEVVTKGLKSKFISQAKASANSQLSQTDWYVVRKVERGVEIPEEVIEARAKIVADTEYKEVAIRAATTVEELMQVI